jgi:hypothetical protein
MARRHGAPYTGHIHVRIDGSTVVAGGEVSSLGVRRLVEVLA